MKKILSIAMSLYQFWIIAIFAMIVVMFIPNIIGSFSGSNPIKIYNVEKKSRRWADSIYTYNNDKTAKLEPVKYSVELTTNPAMRYHLIYRVLQVLLTVLICIYIFRVISSLKHQNPFVTRLDVWLNRIGYMLIVAWIISKIYEYLIDTQLKTLGFDYLKVNEKEGNFLFFAVFAFAFAIILKKGKEYKEENDLTV